MSMTPFQKMKMIEKEQDPRERIRSLVKSLAGQFPQLEKEQDEYQDFFGNDEIEFW